MRAVLLALGFVLLSAAAGPTVKVFIPPDFWGAYAIWGASGVDKAGHIFVGVTSTDQRGSGSAHLFEFNPDSADFIDRGNVVAELERLKLRRPGETQMKIHSKILVASDGLQYFSSMDETGEAEDGSRLPTWGGHLWRRRPTGAWEHCLTTREALIAIATGGPFVYALGYFNHVLYQFDTRTGRAQSVAVGAAGGHVSRNFFADDRGHAFVPRVTREGPGRNDAAHASLVELGPDMKEIGSRPLGEYFESVSDDSHGIVGISPDEAGGWYFTTGKGRLYRETPAVQGTFTLTDLGWIHPSGPRYAASLFRDETSGTIYSASMPTHDSATTFDWITRRAEGSTTVEPFLFGDVPPLTMLYGSMSRDAAGRFYVVGTANNKPRVLQVTVR